MHFVIELLAELRASERASHVLTAFSGTDNIVGILPPLRIRLTPK